MNVPDSPRPSQAGEKGPSAALAFLGGGHAPLPNLPPKLARAQPALERRMRSLVVATYIQVRFTRRFLLPAGRHGAALHLDLFEQPALQGVFQHHLTLSIHWLPKKGSLSLDGTVGFRSSHVDGREEKRVTGDRSTGEHPHPSPADTIRPSPPCPAGEGFGSQS